MLFRHWNINCRVLTSAATCAKRLGVKDEPPDMDMGMPAAPNHRPAMHNPGRHITIAPPAANTGSPDIPVHV